MTYIQSIDAAIVANEQMGVVAFKLGMIHIGSSDWPMDDRIFIDDDGYIFLDGVRVARADFGMMIMFHDKCRRRASERGTGQVSIEVDALREAIGDWQAHLSKSDKVW